MKFTLLEGVQEILSSMDSDEVDSINDTIESYQVALLFKSCYYDLYNDLNLTEHNVTFSLTESGDATLPVIMTVPENITKIDWIKYDNRDTGDTTNLYKDVTFRDLDSFIEMQLGLRDQTEAAEMDIVGDQGTFSIFYGTDRHPQYFTTFDNNRIIFDALDLDIDTSYLLTSKSLCVGKAYPDFTLADEFVPVLDPSQFRYYINRVKVRAFAELKQAQNVDAAQEARRQKIVTQKRKHRVETQSSMKNIVASRFGRK